MRKLPHLRMVGLALAAAMLACTLGGTPDSQTEDQAPASSQNDQPGLLGSIRRETDTVEHGASVDALEPVADEVTLLVGDVLRVRDGGEGLLTFPDGMLLRLFNDTQLNVVAVESDPGNPVEVRMFLEEGGFTGELTAEGGSAVFKTPGGAEITVLGTEFFVVYDAVERVTLAGNFKGHVEAAGAGQSVTLKDGTFVEVPDGGPPGLPLPLTVDRPGFEAVARTQKSPVSAAGASAMWDLTMVYENNIAVSGDLVNQEGYTRHEWNGQFTTKGGTIAGGGDITSGGYSWCVINVEIFEFDWDGTGTFTIQGSVVQGPGGPAFDIYFTGKDLTLSEPPCPSAPVLSALNQAWGTLQSNWELDGRLVVDARDGAELLIDDLASDREEAGYLSDGQMEIMVEFAKDGE